MGSTCLKTIPGCSVLFSQSPSISFHSSRTSGPALSGTLLSFQLSPDHPEANVCCPCFAVIVASRNVLAEKVPVPGRQFGMRTVRPILSNHLFSIVEAGTNINQLLCLLLIGVGSVQCRPKPSDKGPRSATPERPPLAWPLRPSAANSFGRSLRS